MTEIVLRDYQEAAVSAVERSWEEGINRPAVVIATGGGKTTIFSELIGRNVQRLRAEGERILVLAHREELLEQAEARIKKQNPGIWTAVVKGARGQKTHQFADVVVASVQTLARPKRREAVDRIGMVIVDECHNSASKSYKAVLEHYGCLVDGGTPTVGFTATLTRMDGGLPDVWQSVAFQMKIHDLIKRGFLVPPVAKSIEVPGLNLASTRITGGDINTGDLAEALTDSAAFDVIADSWREQAADRPTIVFMPDVRTAEHLAKAFEVRDVTAEVVTGATPTTERRAIYGRYNSGATRVLVNCMVLTEGFDAPATSCVVIGRPTINPGLYIQMTGRGLRLSPGKEDCLILDVAGASLKHSLAGVNDLESECDATCGCNCLSCGCSKRCKCGIRQCGCACVEKHDAPSRACKCAGSSDCVCGCEGDPYETGEPHCVCNLNDECDCRGEGPQAETKEVAAEVLRKLTEVDILGKGLSKSRYQWLTTHAGIRYLTVGKDSHLFLLPAPDGGFFLGRVDGASPKAPVTSLHDGALPPEDARKALEDIAAVSDYTYNSKRAAWRRTPASEAQKGILRSMRIEFPDDITKGQASDAISNAKVSRCLDPRMKAWGYVS